MFALSSENKHRISPTFFAKYLIEYFSLTFFSEVHSSNKIAPRMSLCRKMVSDQKNKFRFIPKMVKMKKITIFLAFLCTEIQPTEITPNLGTTISPIEDVYIKEGTTATINVHSPLEIKIKEGEYQASKKYSNNSADLFIASPLIKGVVKGVASVREVKGFDSVLPLRQSKLHTTGQVLILSLLSLKLWLKWILCIFSKVHYDKVYSINTC